MIKLTLTEKGGEPKALSFDKEEITIGRVSGNDIVLPKGNVSKRHSKIAQHDGRLEVSDLKSTNGTYVNGRKIAEPLMVTAADKIYVGDFMIVLEGEAAALAGNAQGDGLSSGARKVPVPPPPPPPRATSNMARIPAEENDAFDEEEEGLGLAVRPPGAGRMPPPPPPPPRRTPIGNQIDELDEDAFAAGAAGGSRTDSSPPFDRHMDDGDGDGGASGGPVLFARSPARPGSAASDGDDDDFRSSPVTANRPPGDLLAAMVAPEISGGRPTGPVGRGAAETGPAPTFERVSSKVSAGAQLPEEGVGGEARPAEGLDALMADPAVSAIFVLGPETTLVQRDGKIEPFEASLGDPNTVADVLWRIASSAVPPPPPDNPVIDVRLLDGTRIAAVFPPAAPAGVCAAIHKAALPANRTFDDLGPAGTMSKEIQAVLEAAINGQRNLLVTGDASAVTALLGAIAGAIPAERRVVSIGAGMSRARPGWTELAPSGDMPALVRVAAAFRADHLLIAEAGGGATMDVLTAAARGQEGLVFGFPARSASEALARLEALTSLTPGASGVPQLVQSTLDFVVHAVTMSEGGVRITEITETKVNGNDKLVTDPVLVWRSEGGRRGGGGGAGKLQITGVSSKLAGALAASGSTLPAGVLRK